MRTRVLLIGLVSFAIACGSKSPPPPVAPPAASAAAAPVDTSEMHHKAPRPPAPPQLVTVSFDGHQVDVDLAKVGKGGANLPLLDVWKAAYPNDDITSVTFDLVGSDGYRPTLRPACNHLLSATEMAGGKIDAASHDVSWDDSLKLARCYHVQAVARIEGKK